MKKILIIIFILLLFNFVMGQDSYTSESSAFIIDTKSPVVNVIKPNGGEQYEISQNISVQWTAFDDNFATTPIQIIFQNINSNDINTLGYFSNSGNAYVNIPSSIKGQGIVKIIATDAFGNISTDISNDYFTTIFTSDFFVLDTKLPIINLIYPRGNEAYKVCENISIEWLAMDNSFNESPIQFAFKNNDDKYDTIPNFYNNSGIYNMDIPITVLGQGNVKIIARDKFGNIASDETMESFSTTIYNQTELDINNNRVTFNNHDDDKIIIESVIYNYGSETEDIEVIFMEQPLSGSGDNIQIGDKQIIHSLNTMEGKTISVEWAKKNNYRIHVIIDPDNKIQESLETNNSAYFDYGGYTSDSPVINFLNAQYDGNSNPGIIGRFVSGIDVENTFIPNITSNNEIDKVIYEINNEKIINENPNDNWALTYNMGKLIDNTTLTVQVLDKTGLNSNKRVYTIEVVTLPSWIIESGFDYTSDFNNETYLITISLNPDNKFNFSSIVPKDIALLSGLTNNIESHIILNYTLDLNGQSSLDGNTNLNNSFLLSDSLIFTQDLEFELVPTLNTDGTLNPINSQKSISKNFLLREINSRWTIHPFDIPMTLNHDIGAKISLLFEGNMNLNSSLNFTKGTKITSNADISTDAIELISTFGVTSVAMISHPTANIQSNLVYINEDSTSHTFAGSLVIPYKLIGSLNWGDFNGTLYNNKLPVDQDSWTFEHNSIAKKTSNNSSKLMRKQLSQNLRFQEKVTIKQKTIAGSIPDIFPFPTIAMNNLGQGMIVWVKDTDPIQNSPDPELYYSLWDGNISSPKAITSNQNFETNPTISYFPNNNAIMLWTHNKTPKTENLTFTEMLANQEIRYSIYDAIEDSWSDPENITNNNYADGMSQVAISNNSTALATWTHINKQNGNNPKDWEIHYSVWDGNIWTNQSGITNDNSADYDVDVDYFPDGSAIAVWVFDDDGNLNTDNDKEIKYSLWNGTNWIAIHQLTINNHRESSPKVKVDPEGNAWVTWVSNEFLNIEDSTTIERLYITKFSNSSKQWQEPYIVLSDSQFIQNPELNITVNDDVQTLMLSWRSNDAANEYKGDISVSFHDLTSDDEWTIPVYVTSDKLSDWMISCGIDANANAVFVDMKTDFDDLSGKCFAKGNFTDGLSITAKGISEDGGLSDELNYGYMEIKPDLTCAGDIQFYLDNKEIEYASLGDSLTLYCTIINKGALTSNTFNIEFYYGNEDSIGSVLLEETMIPELKPDSSVRIETNWTVSRKGKHSFYFYADKENQVDEQNENNNSIKTDIFILPDLSIQDILFNLDNVVLGDSINIDFIINNQGGCVAENIIYQIEYDDSMYSHLSGNISQLDFGNSDTISMFFKPLTGIHKFNIHLNPDSSIHEQNYENNSKSVDMNLLPDFLVRSTGILLGEDNTLLAQINNIGNAPGFDIPIKFFDGNPNQGGELIDSVFIDLSFSDSTQVSVSWENQPGLHTIFVEVNKMFTINEIDYENNFASQDLMVNGQPDLSITHGNLKFLNPSTGDTNQISVDINNIGSENARNVSIKLFDMNFESDSLEIFSIVIPFIAKNDIYNFTTDFYIPDSSYGLYKFYCIVDDNNVVNESNEDNNECLLHTLILQESIIFPEDSLFQINLNEYYVTPSELDTGYIWSASVIENSSSVINTNISDNILNITPNPNWYGSRYIILSLSNSESILTSDSIQIFISPVNDYPVIISSDSIFAYEDIPFSFKANAIDVDNFFINISYYKLPTWLMWTGDKINGIPREGTQDTSFIVNACDGELAVETEMFIYFISINDPPIISDIPDTVFFEDEILSIPVKNWDKYVYDIDNHDSTLTLSFFNNDSILINLSPDSIIFTPVLNWFGNEIINVTISDGEYFDTTSMNINVIPVNDAPDPFSQMYPDNNSFHDEDSSITFSWERSKDIENDPIDYILHLFNDNYDTLFHTSDTLVKIFPKTISLPVEQKIFWFINSFDGKDSTKSANSPFTFTICRTTGIDEDLLIPEQYAISQNYPNPFNPTTTIKYEIPQQTHVLLTIFNTNGQAVETLVNQKQSPGYYSIQWDATNLPSGVYFYKISADGYSEVMKSVLMK